jgi:hypothetical protein
MIFTLINTLGHNVVLRKEKKEKKEKTAYQSGFFVFYFLKNKLVNLH